MKILKNKLKLNKIVIVVVERSRRRRNKVGVNKVARKRIRMKNKAKISHKVKNLKAKRTVVQNHNDKSESWTITLLFIIIISHQWIFINL